MKIFLNKKIYYLFIVLILALSLVILFCISKENNVISITKTLNTSSLINQNETYLNLVGEEEIAEAREVLNLQEYENLPKEIDGYKVIGKISIPKIEVERYILEETNEDALKKAVTKICGPEINKTGNFCMAGHNYGDTFGKISWLEEGDEILITDTYDRTVKYQVYSIERVSPYNTNCLTQETNGEREITLVTCSLGAITRVIVKGIEVYD